MNQNTLDLLRQLKFYGMHNAFKQSLESESGQELTGDQLIAHLVQSEWDERNNKSIQRKVYNARFRYKAVLEDIYYIQQRNLDKNQIHRFAQCAFIDKYENILITGSTGIGKSYLASALGHHACSLGYRVAYYNVPKLFAKLKMAKSDGSYLKELSKMERQHLLILDDFGLQPLDTLNRAAMMEIIEDRHGKGSVIITSQIPVNKWYDIIGEQTIADAIMDRLIHEAHRLELKGESLRKKEKLMTEMITEFD
ncbi:MAG: IS21-like element helper ATPase IstB [Bacteroidota bacterium]|nr:IS21-like element helper ATPase IstB [Bacteroidota bacterium]